MGGDTSDLVILFAILATRFVVPLFIPRFPLPAILIALVVDAADQSILQKATDLNLDGYQSYDKALDIYYLTVAYVSVYRNWTNGYAVEVARFLWYYRLVGVLLFEITAERWLLLVFANTFEYFFIAYEVVRTCWDPRRLSRRAVIGMAAAIWIFVKLPQEWWIHIAQNDFTDFMKETVFGVEPTSSWADAFSNRPFVLVAIIAVIVGLVVAAFLLRGRLPRRDWPFGVDVDRPDPARRDRRRRRAPPPVDAVADPREARPHRARRRHLLVRARCRCRGVADRRRHRPARARQRRHQRRARTPRSRVEFDRRRVRRPRGAEHRAAADLRGPRQRQRRQPGPGASSSACC